MMEMDAMVKKLLEEFTDQQTITQSYVISMFSNIPYQVAADEFTITYIIISEGEGPSPYWESHLSEGVKCQCSFSKICC